MTPARIEPATFRFVAQHLNHCATAFLTIYIYYIYIYMKLWRNIHFFLFSTLIRRAYVQVYCYRTAFPRSPRHNCTISHIVGRLFLLPVGISSCPVLSAILSLLSAPRDHLQMWDTPDFCFVVVNSSTTNSPAIITVTLRFLVATLAGPGGRAV